MNAAVFPSPWPQFPRWGFYMGKRKFGFRLWKFCIKLAPLDNITIPHCELAKLVAEVIASKALMRNLRLTFLFAIAFLPIVGIAADVPTFDELKQQNASGEMFFNAGLDIFAAASNMAAVAPAYPYFRYAYEAGFEGDSRVYELLGLMQRDGIGTEKEL